PAALAAAESLCGESFVSGRKLAIASAEMLRASPCLPAGTPVHALVLAEGRGTLSAEEPGYERIGTAAVALAAGPALSVAPSPILGASGATSGFGAAGPVGLFGPVPSSLMGAPPPLVASTPVLASGAT